jgi:hypothetical protein
LAGCAFASKLAPARRGGGRLRRHSRLEALVLRNFARNALTCLLQRRKMREEALE